ncbi:MAG: hypothetical protein IPH20_22245 [Bacteroidales bacterium]|nr:hypothetical protein [Bacteroidales bacterium]
MVSTPLDHRDSLDHRALFLSWDVRWWSSGVETTMLCCGVGTTMPCCGVGTTMPCCGVGTTTMQN